MQRRIRQILVHSCIYYRFNDNVVPDHVFDSWGRDLIDMIKEHPEWLNELEYGEYFKNYNETTSGFDLPLGDLRIMSRANHLLLLKKEKGKERDS